MISSTYMAACGLQPGRKGSNEESFSEGANARTMAKFGAAMIRELEFMKFEKFNVRTKPNFQLRIGKFVSKTTPSLF